MTHEASGDRVAQLEADNQRLRQLLDRRDAPGELRHRLNSTLAMLRAIIRKSAATERNVTEFAAHVGDRLNAITRAQATADTFGEIELESLVANELLQYGASVGDRVHLSGPTISLQPRAGQVFALAVHELAVNALEYGALANRTGRIEIIWEAPASPAAEAIFTWKEVGAQNPKTERIEGFGTEVLTIMLRYEFNAQTALSYEADGLRFIIRFHLTEKIGRVDQLHPGKG